MEHKALQALDTIFGAMGRAYITIDGRREELLYVKNIEINVSKNKVEVPVLGRTAVQHKAGGWTGTGSMTIYYCTPIFREMMLRYMKTGVDTYFDLVVENSDPNSNIGKQTLVVKQCNLDDVVLAKIDIEAESMDEDVSFTFEGADMLESFTPVVGR